MGPRLKKLEAAGGPVVLRLVEHMVQRDVGQRKTVQVSSITRRLRLGSALCFVLSLLLVEIPFLCANPPLRVFAEIHGFVDPLVIVKL